MTARAASTPATQAGVFKSRRPHPATFAGLQIARRRRALAACPDHRIVAAGIEIGAGWNNVGLVKGQDHVGLNLARPDIGPRASDIKSASPVAPGRRRLRPDLEPSRTDRTVPAPPGAGAAARPMPPRPQEKAPASEGRGGEETKRGRAVARPSPHSAARMARFGSAANAVAGDGASAGLGRRTPRNIGATALLRRAVANGRRV